MAGVIERSRLKLEGGSHGSANNSILSLVVIQSDASNVSSTVKLNGLNYPFWSKVLEMHIARRSTKGFVTRSIKKPKEDSAEYETWETGNAIVKGFFIHLCTAKEVCAIDLKTLQEEIQLDCAYAFLTGLDDIFDKVRSDILRTQHLPSVVEVFFVVRREAQCHATMMGGSVVGNQGGTPHPPMMSQPPSYGRSYSSSSSTNSLPFTQENKDNLKCSFCGQTRHTEDICFQKHDVPKWFLELKKKLCVNERATNGASGSRASVATATPSNKEAVQIQRDLSQTLLTRINSSESSPNTGTTKEIIGLDTKIKGLYYVDDVVPCRTNVVRASRTRVQPLIAEEGNAKSPYASTCAEVAFLLSSSIVPLSNTSSLNISEFDVNNAFLHGHVEEEVYMDFPPGYNIGGKMGVCQLWKSLYRIKQSSCAWFGRSTQAMRKNGYYQSHYDHTLFVKRRNDLLKETSMLGCKPVDTPIAGKHQLEIYSDQEPVDKAHTCLDIAYAVSLVSQFMHSPNVDHMAAVMQGFTDIDWVGDVTDRRSTSGYFTFVGGNLVTWRSKKQKVVSRSSVEVEFEGMAHGNSVQHDRTKHVEVDWHFIKERLEKKIVSILFVNSEEQLADILTHAVWGRIFGDSLVKLGMCDIYAPT
ncbi:hypothetical protein D8674_025628 [Pyrus ussuriensis x Pyrus communis]|uniref:Reverse transcriptase Ty1/copia-type domain-containing protein n=1 Tax=Pyrus ussuriensis x Pyrus communis TaxID=2448454 RepID=A0A5N5IIN2_9ROSA|nr:hypothetical protein D8674_025628 [Pyrus ussuriensis x Pyrus communis]